MQKKKYLCMDLLFANLSKKLLVVLVLEIQLCLWLCTTGTAAAAYMEQQQQQQQLPAVKNGTLFQGIFGFGDSIFDTGNNNDRLTLAKCNFPPNGRDFNGGIATGRCGNGKLLIDWLAEGFGVKELVPPYLDPNLQNKELLTGVSFASGSSGFDPVLALSGTIHVSRQLELFEKYIKNLTALVGEERKIEILAKSLFVISAGTNDILIAYHALGRQIQYHDDFPKYASYVVGLASTFFKDLYSLGARRIGIVTPGPLGCSPLRRVGLVRRECSKLENEEAILFNSMISSKLQSLNTEFPDAKFVAMDSYNPIHDLVQHPEKSGFEVTKFGCCGTGTIEQSILCNPLTLFTCKDANKYVYWDTFHLAERAARIVASQILQEHNTSFF